MTDPVARLGEIRARLAYPRPDSEWFQRDRDVEWLLEHIEQLQADSAGNAAGLRYWNRRYVETAQQHAVDIAAKDAYRAELGRTEGDLATAVAEAQRARSALAEFTRQPSVKVGTEKGFTPDLDRFEPRLSSSAGGSRSSLRRKSAPRLHGSAPPGLSATPSRFPTLTRTTCRRTSMRSAAAGPAPPMAPNASVLSRHCSPRSRSARLSLPVD